jgi:hypothetical protein
MLTLFAVIQVGINLLLLAGMAALLRERARTANLQRQREERLESLAAELCALGRDWGAGVRSEPPPPPMVEAVETAPPPAIRAAAPASDDGEGGRTRFRAAVALLASGLGVDEVAARTALPSGEVAVLRNLRCPGEPATASTPQSGGRVPLRAVRRPAARSGRAGGAPVVVERGV